MIAESLARGQFNEATRIDRTEVGPSDDEAEGRWVFVRPRPTKEPSQIYSIRLPVGVVEQVRLLAAAKSEAPTALLRAWIMEHVDQELRQHRRSPKRGPVAKQRRGGGGAKGLS